MWATLMEVVCEICWRARSDPSPSVRRRQEGYKEGRKMDGVTIQAEHSDKMKEDVFSVRSETSAY